MTAAPDTGLLPVDLGLDYDDWREHQRRTVVRIATSDAENIVVEAPTGSGKSLTAMATARLTAAPFTLILTAMKQLQEQYLGLTDTIREVRGRNNHTCLTNPMLTADIAPCMNGTKCIYAGVNGVDGCAYWDQKKVALAAPEVVTNYAYALADLNYAHAFARPDVLIMDEAHLIEDQLRSFISVTLRRRTLQDLDVKWPPYDHGDWQMWKGWAAGTRLKPAEPGTPTYRRTLDLRRDLHILARHLDEDWIIRPTTTGSGIEFIPTWVDTLAHEYLFRYAKKRIFLSATLRPIEQFCDRLGLDPAQTEFIEVPSTFPAKRRPLYYQPVGRMKKDDTGVLARLVTQIDAILDAHPHDKGLIHTVSYGLRDYIMTQSRHVDRLMTHGSADRSAQLEAFKAETRPVLMVSPSMGMGIDLPFDQCRVQIICKLPFPYLGDEQVKRRMKPGPDGKPNARGQGWYSSATSQALIQAYGRGMRDQADACACYLLDGSFDWFYPAGRKADLWPGWFTEAIHREGRSPASRVH